MKTIKAKRIVGTLVLLEALAWAPSDALAINITVSGSLGDLDGSSDGAGEALALQIAVEYWTRRITTDRDFTLTVTPTGLTNARGQGLVDTVDGANLPFTGTILIDNDGSTTWYVDPAPRDSAEFDPETTSDWRYDNGPAGSDLLRVLIHETGHALGWICGATCGFPNPLFEALMSPAPGSFVSDATCTAPFPLLSQAPFPGCVFLVSNAGALPLNVSLRGDGLGGSGSSVVNELSHPGIREDLMHGIGVPGGERELMSVNDVNMFFHAYADSVDLPAVADAGSDVLAQCNAFGGADVVLDATGSSDPESGTIGYTWSCPGVALDDDTLATPQGFFLLDTTTTCRLDATDLPLLESDADTVDVSVEDTLAPAINCPADVVVECSAPGGSPATDPAIAAFLAGATATDVCDATPSIGNDAPGFFVVGTTAVVFTATDASTNSQSCSATVSVEDTLPPVITSLTATPSALWPPNHKMRAVALTVGVDDVCDAAPACAITAIASNEPVVGPGAGNTEPDWVQTGPLTLDLRAERSGPGVGRVYSIEVTCTDASDNSASATTEVTVAHDQGS